MKKNVNAKKKKKKNYNNSLSIKTLMATKLNRAET